jgi:hypothetical protein
MLSQYLTVALATAAAAYPTIVADGPIGGWRPQPLKGLWTIPSHAYARGQFKQVVYLSFDGMHQSDLWKYIEMYPNSTWAKMVLPNGIAFNNVSGSTPSDSFPATTAIFTGGSPVLTGIYWDDTWAKDLYPAGSNCTGPIGAEADWSAGMCFMI